MRDAAHQLNMLRRGKKTAEVIMEFKLLVAEAGYSSDTRTDNLHLIKKLQDVLNPSLTKKISYPKRYQIWSKNGPRKSLTSTATIEAP